MLTGLTAPRPASAHAEPIYPIPDILGNTFPTQHYWPEAPQPEVRRAANSPHDSIVVTWNETHYHPLREWRSRPSSNSHTYTRFRAMTSLLDYRIFVRDAREENLDPGTCTRIRATEQPRDGCIRRIVSQAGPSYSETFTGLNPDRTYYVWLSVNWRQTGEQITGSGWIPSRLPGSPGSGSAEMSRYSDSIRRTITTDAAPRC